VGVLIRSGGDWNSVGNVVTLLRQPPGDPYVTTIFPQYSALNPGSFPEHKLHPRFAADGRAAPPLRLKKWGQEPYVIFILIDINSSGEFPTQQGRDVWKALGASLDQPMLQIRPAPSAQMLEARWAELADAARKPTKAEATEGKIEEFLEEVYRLAELNRLQEATDEVFDQMDNLLCGGAFTVCDEILKRVDVRRLPTALLRSFLTITAAAKEKLPARKAFYNKAFAEVTRQKGPEKTHRLLAQLA